MRHALAVAALSAAVSATSLFAQLPPECGTTDARIEQVEQLRVWSSARRAEQRSKGLLAANSATTRDGIFVLPGDDINAPFRRPFDLHGRSLIFTKKDDQTFARENVALAYDDVTGVSKFTPKSGTVGYTIQGFSFPFRGKSYSQLTLSGFGAIHLGNTPLAATAVEQYGDADLAGVRQAVISPLWTTPAEVGTQYADVYVKQFSDRVSVSWIVSGSIAAYDVQASLFKNGDIRFSYKAVTKLRAAGLVITSGDESWRSNTKSIVSATDFSNDVSGNPAANVVPLLDIQSASLARVAGTNLLEARIKTRGALSQLTTETLYYYVYIGDPALKQSIIVSVNKSGTDFVQTPVWGQSNGSPAAHMEGDTLVVDFVQDKLIFSDLVSVRFYSQLSTASNFADSLITTTTFDAPTKNVATDFRNLTSDETSGPIVEAFTLPVLSVADVWSQIKAQYNLTDSDIDGLAIYQNFYTDIILYAGAYSTGGNAGASGIKLTTAVGPNLPRSPALLHMNTVDYGWNSTDANAGHVVLHEFGHRWLLQLNIMENGKAVRVLNPVSSHPAQYIHTPAAFTVVDSNDASVMGGAKFTDNGDGTFSTPPFDNFSYSWLDLYLMGLASKSEVTPWYYIANSNPALGDAYYPPPSKSFSGQRKDVLIQQVIDAMGERTPAYPNTQRKFRVLFVLLTDVDHPATDAEIQRVGDYRRFMEKNFALATGGRAEVSTAFQQPAAGPRRHAAGH